MQTPFNRFRTRRALLALGAGSVAARGARAAAASFVMLERHDCAWCRRWLREVGESAWNLSDLGRRAPLRRVDVARGLPPDLGFIANWRFTPTFVLVAQGREIGRIIGYQADLFFWQQAEALFARLPPSSREEG
ncbi:hypothetical protein [Rubritepida flocculans]|uniref:hypothetical protein n=1 Tax=Rubritepida flocculans TaxID=182403 RepID=UPI000428DCBB|nr:hypothetical protein [Rubritepida flocculans]